jgi:hypothetical protein
MPVSVEWTTGIIRAGDDHKEGNYKYDVAGTILKNEDHVILKGFAGKLPKHFRRDMRQLLKSIGVKTVEWKIGVDSDTENEVKGGGKV